MERFYCSRCLKSHRNTTSEHCPHSACEARRPEDGWPKFRGEDELIDGRFRVLRMVGSGGSGLTYRCLDLDREEVVALKVLHSDRRYGMLAQRMALEGQLLELLDHPGIVPFRGIQIVGPGPAWLATTFQAGGTLADQVRESGPLPLSAVAELAVQLGETLDYIHRSGVVHRDIKPSNLLLKSNDLSLLKVQVADFGIARLFGNSVIPVGVCLTQSGLFVGTPEFAAPEQMRGERDIGPGADKYALGAVLHFAATGESLFQCSSPADWLRRRDSVWLPSQRSRLASDVSPGERALAHTLDQLIDGLMAPDQRDRLSLGVLLESLAPYSRSESRARIEISRTLCEVPEPKQMQAMAGLWSQTEALELIGSMEPVVAVTRAEVRLPELLSDSWTTGLATPDEYLPKAETPMRIAGHVAPQRPSEGVSVDVEVSWLPRATRRRRALVRVLAAVLVLSLGLKGQDLRSQGHLPSVRTVLLDASDWLESAPSVRSLRQLAHIEQAPTGAVLAAAAPSTNDDPVGRTELRSAKVTKSRRRSPRPPVAAEVRPPNRPGVSASAPVGVRGGLAKRAPQKIAPTIVVGSDDVWGVKSYRVRTVGDALAYDSEDEDVLERLFGEY